MKKATTAIALSIALGLLIYIGLAFTFASMNPKDMNITVKGFSMFIWVSLSILFGCMPLDK